MFSTVNLTSSIITVKTRLQGRNEILQSVGVEVTYTSDSGDIYLVTFRRVFYQFDIKIREGRICWIRVYSLPTDKARAETSVCSDYPGKEGLKDIDLDVNFLEKIAFSKYGIQAVIMISIAGMICVCIPCNMYYETFNKKRLT